MAENNKVIVVFSAILILFLGLHFSGIHSPYHQDEYKWVQYSHPDLVAPGTVPHPPLTEFIYTKIGPLVGDDNFRVIPFSFGILNFFLLFYLVRFLYDKKTALIAVSIFTLSFYSLLASLMVDVDGAVMPFFLLIFLIGYFKWKSDNFRFVQINYKWIAVLLIGVVGGLLVKVSTILPLAAASLDFALIKGVFNDKKKIFKYIGGLLAGAFILALLLVASKFIFPFFNLKYSLNYWEHFATSSSFFGRGWLQTAIQTFKSVLYLSPLLLLSPFYLDKIELKKLRVLFLFILFSFIFYVILFDFSLGALDRYWQLLVLLLTIISSVVFSKYVNTNNNRFKEFAFIGVAISLLLILFQSLPHYVPPLYPKTEWISRAVSFKWTFLYPFSGGSGPLGFYVSFLFLALTWIISFFLFAISIWKKEYRNFSLILIIILSLGYNLIFTEEYLFGFYNGSAPKLVKDATAFVKQDTEIKMVTVYNDNGGWNIMETGKYRRRLYIDPKFDVNVKIATMNKYKEHYLVIDIPHIDEKSAYAKYFDSCRVAFQEKDKYISGTVYDCRNISDIKI